MTKRTKIKSEIKQFVSQEEILDNGKHVVATNDDGITIDCYLLNGRLYDKNTGMMLDKSWQRRPEGSLKMLAIILIIFVSVCALIDHFSNTGW